MNTRLTYHKEQCLRALARGNLERHGDGWKPVDGRPGCWNHHTVTWLWKLGYCRITDKPRLPIAYITEAGRYVVSRVDMVEYA